MGRDARLRQQRRQQRQTQATFDSANAAASAEMPHSERSPFQNLEEFNQIEVPAIAHSALASESESSPPSWLERLLPSKPAASSTLYQSSQEANEFFNTYQTTLGAIAWHGYKTQGRGFVLATPTPHETVQLRYVSRKTLKQFTQPEERAVCRQTMEMYDPQTKVILVMAASTGDMMLSSPQATEPPPQVCYQQWREQELD